MHVCLYTFACMCIYKYGKIPDTYREMSDGSNFSCHLHDGAHVLVTNGTRKGSSRATNENCKNDRK